MKAAAITTEDNNNNNIGPNAKKLREICPALFHTLEDNLLSEIDSFEEGTDEDETNTKEIAELYWNKVHLMFLLRAFIFYTKNELGFSVLEKHNNDANTTKNKDSSSSLFYPDVSVQELNQRLKLFQHLLPKIESSIQSLSSSSYTLINQISSSYHLTPKQTLLFQFLITLQTRSYTTSFLLPNLLQRSSSNDRDFNDESSLHSEEVLIRICGMNSLEIECFMKDGSHDICRDRILIWKEDEYGSSHKLFAADEVCRALVCCGGGEGEGEGGGSGLRREDLIKLSGTRFLKVVCPGASEEEDFEGGEKKGDNEMVDGKDVWNGERIEEMLQDLAGGGGEEELVEGRGNNKKHLENESNSDESVAVVTDSEVEEARLNENKKRSSEDSSKASSEAGTTSNDKDPKAYENELDYLTDQFDLVIQQVQASRQRAAQDIKEADIPSSQPRWMRAHEGTSNLSMGEINAKIKLARAKIQQSLEETRRVCSTTPTKFYPRLESLVLQLGLAPFEKFVLIYLAGSMISPIFKHCIKSSDHRHNEHTTVGDLLNVYFDNFSQQVASRTFFYRSSPLIRKGLVRLHSNGYTSNSSDLTDQEIQLDRRVLDCIVGLDKESTEIADGSHLYEPKIDLDSVILPSNIKEEILDAVSNFDCFRNYRRNHHQQGEKAWDETLSYGVGLTLMFCGPSGTGKTLTANAIAAKLKKKLLLVDFPRLHENPSSSSGGGGSTTPFRSIFREAELSNAILFFDECESLFAQRSGNGSSDTAQLLTELERFEGIVILATNRPYDLDEAMYRRISRVFDFKAPNYLERLQIWKMLLRATAVPSSVTDEEWEEIALKYELTGGFIKNAILAALLSSAGRDPTDPRITRDDIIDGCKKQMRGALQMVDFDERVVPRSGLEEYVSTPEIKDQLREIIRLEKARGILFGSWGFDDDMRDRQGTTALFWGRSGTGRSRAAEAVGYELGKALKVVDLVRLMEDKRGGRKGGADAIRDVFKEARLMDAVLVLDGFSLDHNSHGGSGGSTPESARLLNLVVKEMTRFPGVVIMMVDTTGSLDVFVSRLETNVLNGLKFLVEFTLPKANNRLALWQKLMPKSVPTRGSIDFNALAESSVDFNHVQIGNVIYRAAANAALRLDTDKRFVSMEDLLVGIKEEKKRGESAVDRYVKSQYL